MARACYVCAKGPTFGNNVSHANNKTRRRFLPNLQETSLYSDALKRMVRLRLTTSAIRTIERKGGLDAFLLGTNRSKLSLEAQRLRRQIARAAERQNA